MIGFCANIEKATRENGCFRQVLYTAPHCQLVVMTLQPGEDIGLERHQDGDQFIRVESGKGEATIDGRSYPLADGVAVVIPAGSMHNVLNSSRDECLRLYTIYAPPEHPDGTIHRTKRDAMKAGEERLSRAAPRR